VKHSNVVACHLLAVALFLPSLSFAQKTVAIAAGDCKSSELTGAMTQFHELLRVRLKTDLYDPDLVYNIVRPRALRGIDEIQRQVESARTLFYAGQTEKALEVNRQAMVDLQKVSPLREPWAIAIDALLVEGLVYRSTGQRPQQLSALRRIARLEPTLKLDTNLYAPSYITLFEQVKKEVTKAKKATLSVQSSPQGADVYLDGKKVGVTPFKQAFVSGDYQLALASPQGVSFIRTVKLKSDEVVVVDMGFETALSVAPPLCTQVESEADAVGLSSRLAASIGTDRTVVFRLVSKPGEPPYFRAILLMNGDEERSGNVRPGGLAELADFVLTGKALPPLAAQRGPDRLPTKPKEPEVKAPPVVTPTAPTVTTPPSTTPPQEPLPPVSQAVTTPGPVTTATGLRGAWARPVGWSVAGLGVVAIVTGSLVYTVGGAPLRAELDALTPGVLFSDKVERIRSVSSAAERNRVASFAAIGAGVGALLTGLFLAIAWPQSPVAPTVSAGLTSSGGSLTLSGAF
jgi:hypothetical protein